MILLRPFLAVLALGFCAGLLSAQTVPLNDTGIVFSGADVSGNASICEASASTVQDCHNGRDAAAAAGLLTKVGASTPNNGLANGFDYTKISNAGNPLSASATLGSGANDWACTRDNVTGLTWEVKTASGFRSMNHTYSWYDSASPDGNAGTASGGTCSQLGRCDTEKFVQDVNANGLCDHHDWRMPSRRELLSIVDYGRTRPAIDPGYFPNTPSLNFWSGSPYAQYSNYAWFVYFFNGNAHLNYRIFSLRVLLVRGGQ